MLTVAPEGTCTTARISCGRIALGKPRNATRARLCGYMRRRWDSGKPFTWIRRLPRMCCIDKYDLGACCRRVVSRAGSISGKEIVPGKTHFNDSSRCPPPALLSSTQLWTACSSHHMPASVLYLINSTVNIGMVIGLGGGVALTSSCAFARNHQLTIWKYVYVTPTEARGE